MNSNGYNKLSSPTLVFCKIILLYFFKLPTHFMVAMADPFFYLLWKSFNHSAIFYNCTYLFLLWTRNFLAEFKPLGLPLPIFSCSLLFLPASGIYNIKHVSFITLPSLIVSRSWKLRKRGDNELLQTQSFQCGSA